ncbi:hypothetical protein [Pseudomonas gingeri]|uniref:Uncharacterized protein n=1 Tax=Pseudomonas gingeri TaxID=117681 RepID=A0A7Y7WSG4_9PSED|nr:hypothetical protein [Pseudomonas gingeri]NWB86889.1 hypothetical protein [Pseudomonas gingeri]
MSFVYESIGADVANAVRWETYPEYQNSWKAHPDAWVIDRELDVFIWRIKGRMPEWPNQIFGACWKGDGNVRAEVIESLKVTPDTEGKLCDVFWDVISISLPALLEPERALIERAFKDALEALSKHRSGIANVQVSIR